MVLNTPRTLGEILPVLMQRIIVALAASGADQRTGASRCLGELVRKLAERVLPTIVPILQEGLKHPDGDTRQVRPVIFLVRFDRADGFPYILDCRALFLGFRRC